MKYALGMINDLHKGIYFAGAYLDLGLAFRCTGRKDSCIMEVNKDHDKDKILFIWNDEDSKWDKIAYLDLRKGDEL